MKIYGVTKGTVLEEKILNMQKGEEQGAGMYSALSQIAKEKGLIEVSETLMRLAIEEIQHAGMYSILNGSISEDIFPLLEKASAGELKGVDYIKQLALEIKNLGHEEASLKVGIAAIEEGTHGETLQDLIDRFRTK